MDVEEIEGIGVLPRDLIVDTLSRLPVKILCKFKCVSKGWRNLISFDPQLKNLHRNRSKKNPKLLLSRYDYIYNLDSLKFESNVSISTLDVFDKSSHNNFDMHITDSGCFTIACCDLMCLITYENVHVCNPSTQEFAKLPPLPVRTNDLTVGFGYLPSEDAYKIVILSLRGLFFDVYFDYTVDNADDMHCEIFSLREGDRISGSWKDIGNIPCLVTKKNGVCADGEIFWMALEDGEEEGDKMIVSLDLSNEEFRIITFTQCDLDPSGCNMELVELKGFLCIVNHLPDASTIDIWMLKDRANFIWIKECSIDLFQLDCIEILGYIPLSDQDGEILVWSHGQSLLYNYNIKNETLTAVEQLDIEGPASMCLYFDSFLSLGTR